MTSKNYIKDIQMFINEAYSDKEPLQENQIKSKRVFNDYCNEIKQDLDRLERLEKVIDILKAVLDRVLIFKFKEDIISGGNIYISKIDSNNTTIVNLRKPEYDLLKEVLE